jgi:hypothetical protein
MRITYLMDIESLTLSLDSQEWLSIGKIFLKLVEKRLENSKAGKDDRLYQELQDLLATELKLSEEEFIHVDLLS